MLGSVVVKLSCAGRWNRCEAMSRDPLTSEGLDGRHSAVVTTNNYRFFTLQELKSNPVSTCRLHNEPRRSHPPALSAGCWSCSRDPGRSTFFGCSATTERCASGCSVDRSRESPRACSRIGCACSKVRALFSGIMSRPSPQAVTYGITDRMKDIEKVLAQLEELSRKWRGDGTTAGAERETTATGADA